MATLIIYKGDEDLKLTPSQNKTYLYRIGSGNINGRDCEEINDAALLNDIATEFRDTYTHWIYSLNKESKSLLVICFEKEKDFNGSFS